MKKINFHFFKKFLFILFIWSLNTAVYAQCWELVWADEFDGISLDNSKWEYGIGTSNDNVHYYTGRNSNVTVSDGTLKIIALEESYQGLSYTSGLIKTNFKAAWKYGRIEARIKLPASNGFVPAFWMLPEDNIYGWWPNSGEIDIMEHPTNQVNQIYGTVHTRAYNSFTGSGPRGDIITISDAETEFHVYAVEWTADQIDFFVDEQKYFTFYNDNSGNSTWPFNQQFYVILNLAVGGGWVGNPNSSTVFPAIMEVDYVRVFQNVSDINISGPEFLIENDKNITYALPNISGAAYTWNLPGGAQIISGQSTNKILTDWGSLGGSISADFQLGSCSTSINYAVNVSSNYVLNASFEKGGKYWDKAVGYPASADFEIVSNEVKNGNNSLKVDVKNLGNYPWDIQLSQKGFELQASEKYEISLWAKAANGNGKINVTLINPATFFVYISDNFTVTDSWAKFTLTYTPSNNITASLNIDLGSQTGVYYLDDLTLKKPTSPNSNPVVNYDFSNGKVGWFLNSWWPAVATGDVINGEYKISINNGGVNVWDIFLGQGDLLIEKGKEYTVSFDAYADAPRTISALVGMNSSPWTVYSGNNVKSITASKQTYTYSFVMNSTTDTQARLGFDVGGSTHNIYFDNIYLNQSVTSVSAEFSKNYAFTLEQNYPNPFNPTTTIKFTIPLLGGDERGGLVSLRVFDVLGNEVKTLINKEMEAGYHSVDFNASDLPSGVYFYQLKTGEFIQTRKMVLMK